MSKVFMISLLLLLTLSSCVAARPVARSFRDTTPMEIDIPLDHPLKVGGDSAEKMETGVDKGCEGLGEDECMMRRTLAAHIDYIYTQNHQP